MEVPFFYLPAPDSMTLFGMSELWLLFATDGLRKGATGRKVTSGRRRYEASNRAFYLLEPFFASHIFEVDRAGG